ncbi:MAG: type II toxin-antitoxin system RelE/ParE family toxin [Gammaproteobacteria bacterium]
MKPITFLGNTLRNLREFPESARREAGFQLDKVQRGLTPDDFKPMPIIGSGVYEIRVRDSTAAYRVIYIAKLETAVFVLHAFKKKAQRTAKSDIELAQQRLDELLRRWSR